jgi:pSer/pThr/pTyr-binding forkhead associated (FHA) protein
MNAFKLKVMKGVSLAEEYHISRPLVKIGRSPKNDLIMNDRLVSRFQAEIRAEGDRYRISDLGSTNPTQVNNQVIDEEYLEDGDELIIGGSVLKFYRAGMGKTETPGKTLSKIPPRQLILIGLIVLCLIYLLIPSGKDKEEQPSTQKLRTIASGEIKPTESLREKEQPVLRELSVEERLKQALSSYEFGKKKLSDWRISRGNLALAIKALEKSLFLVEGLAPLPEFYLDAKTKLEEARQMLDAEFKKHRFEVEKSIRFANWEEARRELTIIQEILPEPSSLSDPRAVYAREKLRKVENKLKLGY